MVGEKNSQSIWDAQLRSVIESALDAVITIDVQGRVVDWNQAAIDTLGWSREEALGQSLAELVIPQAFRERHAAGMARFRECGATNVVGKRLELVALRRDGAEIPIELMVTRLEKDGSTYFLAYVRDVTEWQRQEELQNQEVLEAKLVGESAVEVARAESYEDSLQRILSTLCEQIDWPIGHVWLPDESGKRLVSAGIWYVGRQVAAKHLQYETARLRFSVNEGLPGEIWKSRKPRWVENIEDARNFDRKAAALADGLRCVFAFPVSSNDRLEAVLEFFHTEELSRDDDLLRIVGRIDSQIGELVRVRHYENQQARLAAIVDSSYDAIIGKDRDGVITSWNAGAEHIYGYTEDEAIGRSIGIILQGDRDKEEPEIARAIETGQRLEQFQTTRCRKDGALIPVSLTVSPVIDGSGRIAGSSTIERDISNRLRREQELQDAKKTAVHANRARGEFLANVSHELRTPMNAILGMTKIALETDLGEEVRDYISTAHEAAQSLLALLNEILDFSKLESGRFTITNEPFSIANVIEETLKTVSTDAFAKGIELICDVPNNLPRRLIGDPMRVRQILTNLLSNAIKFTEQGEVVLQVSVVRLWPQEIRLRFAVIDTGIGIPADKQRAILEPFAQVDASTTREHGGTGLGLAICSELLRLMGGRLSVASEMAQGSTFSFRLSFDLTPDSTTNPSEGLPLEELREMPVLVVDDNETNRRILSDTLANWTMNPVIARDADQATGILQRAVDEGRAFPLVIVDALMPGTDGYELSKRVAEMTPAGDAPVILMVSSTDRREFKEREDEANITVFLQKPVTQSDLMDAVMKALNVQPPQRIVEAIRPQDDDSLTPLSILLAEDTPANQKVATSVLKKRGHSVTVANNGREAVELAKNEAFDVILMDVQMPILDGFQATAMLRDMDRSSGTSTPIIAMTAHAMRGDREKCLEAGMDAYIAKPLDVKQLVRLVESIGEDSSETDVPQSKRTQPSALILDYAGAMQRLGDDVELFHEFVSFYDEDSKTLLATIEQSIQSCDAASLRRAAHSLKGLAGNLGAAGVVAAAQLLENAGKNEDFDQSTSKLQELRVEMKRLDEALRPYRQ